MPQNAMIMVTKETFLSILIEFIRRPEIIATVEGRRVLCQQLCGHSFKNSKNLWLKNRRRLRKLKLSRNWKRRQSLEKIINLGLTCLSHAPNAPNRSKSKIYALQQIEVSNWRKMTFLRMGQQKTEREFFHQFRQKVVLWPSFWTTSKSLCSALNKKCLMQKFSS